MQNRKKTYYLHSVVHGRDSVYTAFTNGVGAHTNVLLQLVKIGELGRAPVHLEGTFKRVDSNQKRFCSYVL